MIMDMGVEIQTNTKMGEDISFDELLNKHDVIFIGIGLGRTRSLEIPGISLNGIQDTIDFVKEYKTNPPGETVVGKNVVVIGGGNTSIDAATAAKRAGADAIAAALPKALADIVNSVLSAGMAIAAIIGLRLDNLIPASDEERGITQTTVK